MSDLLDRIRALRNRARPGGESLSVVVSECIPIARALGLDDWTLLLELHLNGFRKSEWGGEDEPPGGKQKQEWAWKPGLAVLSDRSRADKTIANHPLLDLEELSARTALLLETKLSVYEGEEAKSAHDRNVSREIELAQILNRIRTRVLHFVSIAEGQLVPAANKNYPAEEAAKKAARTSGGKVFIGHGRSNVWLELKAFLEDRLGLSALEFNRISPAGVATTNRLDELLSEACFAFLILTGEDVQADGTVVARENVVHELGLFQGRLGVSRAIAVLEDGCNELSNIHGLGQIRFARGYLSHRFEEIRAVLEREGIIEGR